MTIGDHTAACLVQIDRVTGIPTEWRPTIGPVNRLKPEGDTLFVAGYFSSFEGQPRDGLLGLNALHQVSTNWGTSVPKGFTQLGALAPAPAGGSFFVCGMFTQLGGYSVSGVARLVPEDSLPPIVRVTAPAAGATIALGVPTWLAWSVEDDHSAPSVDVFVSRTSASGPWELVAASIPNTGTFLWNVNGTASAECWVRVVAMDNAGNLGAAVSSGSFAIAEDALSVPSHDRVARVELDDLAPNPCSGSGRIAFNVPHSCNVRVRLLDVQGRECIRLAEGPRPAGRHVLPLDVSGLRPGLYFLRLTAADGVCTRRVVVSR
jgi:hypothetical protein